MNLIVTTGQKAGQELIQRAREIAKALGARFVLRNATSIEGMKTDFQTDVVLVVTKQRLVAHTREGELFFHLNMAQLRIQNIIRGQIDHMIEAMQLRKGMSVLDCTLGMGTDAIVASYIVGKEGRVVGVEHTLLTAFIVQTGLRDFPVENRQVKQALERIEVIQTDYNQYLRSLPGKSFDVVYLDPMFRHPIKSSASLQPLRALADHRAIADEAIQEAKRVARHCIVVKENRQSNEFRRLMIENIVGGKYSSVNYGVIRVGDDKSNR